MLTIQTLTKNNIKDVHFWVPPCPASILLVLTLQSLEKIDIKIREDEDDYDDSIPLNLIPRRIYINDQLINSESEEAKVVWLLSYLIEYDLLGHKEGIAVFAAKESIEYFTRSWNEDI
ncbi:hypothetical protein [Psychromonas algicola]|uniref:hypothetical protein n=1 Tax=Psychromonas algicola TaxID=2555642 RepID=UPI001068508C|nr:hypothetical protein [Psychromonas sp. RZ5]TEW52375.1 hypothetical protein E2R67_03440 [Psychromonas sp. RZ5]